MDLDKFNTANKKVKEEMLKALNECVRGFQVPCEIVYGIDAKDNEFYENGLSTAQNLKNQTYGIKGEIPARDAMYIPVIANSNVIGEIFKKSFRHTKDDEWKLLKACKMTARWIATNIVQATILQNGNGEWHPLSQFTIMRKKQNKNAMLRETEKMFYGIKGYAIDKFGKKI